MPLVTSRFDSPVGPLLAGALDRGICLLAFADGRESRDLENLAAVAGERPAEGRHPHLALLGQELTAYFAGELTDFTVPLALFGSPFQSRVWDALTRIPYGETCSYEDLARAVGSPRAVRAVGTANGRNRVAIVVPCHRVINKGGGLGGYGGGLPIKRFLLDLEGRRHGLFEPSTRAEITV